jgi:hypothetical protein
MPRWLRRTLTAFGAVTLLGVVAAGVGAVWIASLLLTRCQAWMCSRASLPAREA